MDLKEKALQLATKAHAGQFRRDGVTPYINHPIAVAEKLKDEREEVIAAAALHDIQEETNITSADLYREGFPQEVIEAVELLTKWEGIDYTFYLSRLKYNEIARKVKIADMLHNLSETPTKRQIIKYAKGLLYLMEE
jgi:(p)ppGpp synthase/HD superfamily hydrolase